jgi:hypothetical protein
MDQHMLQVNMFQFDLATAEEGDEFVNSLL